MRIHRQDDPRRYDYVKSIIGAGGARWVPGTDPEQGETCQGSSADLRQARSGVPCMVWHGMVWHGMHSPAAEN